MILLELSESADESLILTLFDVANHLARSGEAMAAQEGLTSQQWLVLLQIAGDPNFPRSRNRAVNGVLASEIASARGVSRANVSTLVGTLLRRGLIRQSDHPQDRRRKLLTLTDGGRNIVERLEPLRRGANQKLFAGIEPAMKKKMLSQLRQLLHKLEELPRASLRARARVAAKRS